MFLSAGLRFTALFMRVSESNFAASLDLFRVNVQNFLGKSTLPFLDSRERAVSGSSAEPREID